MEDEKKLYPLKFIPLKYEYSWGKEEFLIADLGYRDSLVHDGWLSANTLSEVMTTYLDRLVGNVVFDYYGDQFPLCIRHIQVKGKMPLQVHPDSETAADRYDALGKEKLWYIIRSGKDAAVMLGLKDDCDAAGFLGACADGSIEGKLNVVAPHSGQVLHIAPGTVHAASGEMEILEISEASALDFCLCTWGNGIEQDEFDPELDIVDALDFIDLKAWKNSTGKRPFQAKEISLKNTLSYKGGDSFAIYSCVNGRASVKIQDQGLELSYSLEKGETLLVPAEIQEYLLEPGSEDCTVIETCIPEIDNTDPYINPGAEATLGGEEEQI